MTAIAQCWKVTRTDATVFAFTDHDVDLTVGGVLYESAIGFVPSAIERGTTLAADNQELSGLIDSDSITAADLRTGKWDGARVEIIEVDWTTETKLRTVVKGFLGQVEIADNQYSATLTSLEAELAKPVGRTVALRCDADLGDTRCGYSLSADTGSVTTVVSRLSVQDSALTAADGHYNGGKVTFTSGGNNGLTADIKRYVAATDTVELFEPLPYDLQIGDTFNVYQGCDKTMETCRDTFSNLDNFRGFPHLPGVKDMVGGSVS